MNLKKFAMLVSDRNHPVKNSYAQKIEQIYNGDIETVDFFNIEKTLKLINDRISNLADGELSDTLMRDDLFRVSR